MFFLSNCSASSGTVRETVKNSKASQVQAKKPTRKNNHCWRLSIATSLKGFGAFFIGGFKVDTRVAIYLPADIFCRFAVSKGGSESRDSSRCLSYSIVSAGKKNGRTPELKEVKEFK